MKVDKHKQVEFLHGEEGEKLTIVYDNRGEPFREGISMTLEDRATWISLFIEDYEAIRIRDLLLKLYPLKVLNERKTKKKEK